MSKVLVVEDDNNLREIYETSLKAEGYETSSASDGMEALEVASHDKPDLIISDVMMPRLSGFEMLEKMRQDENLKAVPVIMMTALSMAEDKETAKRLGVVHYLVKSQVTLEDFVNVAKKFIDPGSASGATAVSQQPTDAVVPEPVAPIEPVPATPAPEPTPVVEEPVIEVVPEPVAPIEPVPATPAPEPTPVVEEPTQTQSTDEVTDTVESQIQDFVDNHQPIESSDIKTAPIEPVVETPSSASVNPVTAPQPQTDTNGKKIIEPIVNPDKKDIHQLAKEEETNQAANEPVKNPSAGSSVDPNSIAL